MRTILLALLLACQPAAYAAQTMRCQINSLYPRMEIEWNDRQVTVHVVSPKGFGSLPQWESPVSLDSIPFMQMQGKELASLGDEFTFQWPRGQCEKDPSDEWLISCVGTAKPVGKAESAVSARLFSTARIDEKSLSGKQSTLRLRFIFENQNLYFTAIPFPLPKCALE